MNTAEKISLLNKVNIIQGLRDKDISEIAELANIISLKEGDTLFNEGDLAKSLFIVSKGKISIYKGAREIVQFGESDVIGEMAILDSGTRSATAKAKTDVTLLEINESVFQETLGNKNVTLQNILKILSQRIREADQKLAIDHMIMTTLIHDINNSITTFSAASLIHQMAEEGSIIKKYSKIMTDAQKSLVEMIQSALDMYRRNEVITAKHDENINKTLEQALHVHLSNHPDVVKIKIVEHLQPTTVKVLHNANDMIRVFVNLVVNAAQASQSGDTVEIRLEYLDHFCQITVKDSGCGIPPENHQTIFRPGFTSKPKGNGLGLFSCKNIVEKMHNGTISVKSEENQGSTFTICLPLSEN